VDGNHADDEVSAAPGSRQSSTSSERRVTAILTVLRDAHADATTTVIDAVMQATTDSCNMLLVQMPAPITKEQCTVWTLGATRLLRTAAAPIAEPCHRSEAWWESLHAGIIANWLSSMYGSTSAQWGNLFTLVTAFTQGSVETWAQTDHVNARPCHLRAYTPSSSRSLSAQSSM